MKKILLFLVMISLLTSCYDEFRLDYEFSSVAFSSASGGSNEPGVLWRTVVKDEGLKLDAGIYLGGILDNKKERWADFVLDPTLLTDTDYTLLPSDYYTLSNDNRFIIPAGETIGKIKVVLDSIKFLNDPLALKRTYAIPFKLTETSEDSISSQNTQILVLKYINHYEGFYEHKGQFKTIDDDSGNTLNNGPVNNVLSSKTFSPYGIETNGSINIGEDFKMKLIVNNDNTVSLEYSPNLEPVVPKNIALDATVIAPSVSGWENADGIKDDYQPTSSMDKNGAAFGNWPSPETENYIEYDFGGSYSINKSNVYWWIDSNVGDGGIGQPYYTYLKYWDIDLGEWVLLNNDNPVVNGVSIPADEYGDTDPTRVNRDNPSAGVLLNQYNTTTFDPVVTNKLRVYFKGVDSTGMLEWQVWGVPAASSLETATIKNIIANGTNKYDPATSTFTLSYTINYQDQSGNNLGYHSDVTSTMKWRNRIRDGVNEWRR